MRNLVFVLAALGVLAGSHGVRANDRVAHASAVIYNAAGQELGVARFTEDATGRVHVNVHVQDLAPGLHGIHLHAVGSCIAPSFTSADAHFNPTGAQHGLDNPHGSHAGDLPNLVVNEAGRGRLNATTDRATLTPGNLSLFDANGSAVVIHAGPDDQHSDPSGKSGARVACGVIVAQ
jgi:Cu-Zn family superoxide dismutase